MSIPNVKVTVDKDFDASTICPFCGNNDDVLQYLDYVEVPMIWCWKCGAKSFLKCELDDIEFSEKQTETEFELLKILEVVDQELTKYRSSRKLSTEEVTEIIQSKVGSGSESGSEYHNSITNEMIEKYKLIEADPDDNKYGNYDDYDILFNMALSVNSYNLSKPEIDYPSKIEITHNGGYIYCKLENQRVVKTSGD